MRIEEIDKNFAGETVDYQGMTTRHLPCEPFEIRGLYRAEPGDYRRLPHEVAAQCNEALQQMYLCTAGGRIRFRTDSRRVILKCAVSALAPNPNGALMGTLCFDLYADGEYVNTFRPDISADGSSVSRRDFLFAPGYESLITVGPRQMRELEINFPLYSDVKDVWIALEEDAALAPPRHRYAAELPVVYYGTSITQGGSASHAGNAYPAMLSRRLNTDHINLGFSDGGRGEQAMAEYIAALPMSALVIDYDANARGLEQLRQSHEPFFRTVRAAQPDLPVIFTTSTVRYGANESALRREVICTTYRHALEAGDRNVWFTDGLTFYEDFGGSNTCTVDGTHPNDLGFWAFAEALEPLLRQALKL